MDKDKIKSLLRESGNTPHINHAKKSGNEETNSGEYDKIVTLLNNDIFNHAAIVRRLPGEPWVGNSEATNRSLFRKQLKKMKNDDGGSYEFSPETLADLQKIMMNAASTISNSIGRQGK
jgi:hypothetical protein